MSLAALMAIFLEADIARSRNNRDQLQRQVDRMRASAAEKRRHSPKNYALSVERRRRLDVLLKQIRDLELAIDVYTEDLRAYSEALRVLEGIHGSVLDRGGTG